MVIRNIRTIIVGNPWKNWVFVKIQTDEGLEGLGECTYGLGTQAVAAVLEELRPLLIGEDPGDIDSLGVRLHKALFLVEDPLFACALSGINIACWDLLGKKAGLPLYKLLGGKCRDRIRVYANGWYQGPRDPAFFAAKAREVVALGYTALKFDPFGNAYQNLDSAEERLSMRIVAEVREAVGPDVDILIEAHDRFALPTAIRIGRLLEEYRPMWYETPVLSYDIPATIEVARAVPVPVASGERFITLRQLTELLQARNVDIVQPDTLRIGGVSGILAACAIARGFAAQVAPHNAQSPFTTAVNTHVGIAVSNYLIQECFDDYHVEWASQILQGYPRVSGGFIEPLEAPGIGVELDEAAAARYPYDPQNCLRLFEAGWERRRMK